MTLLLKHAPFLVLMRPHHWLKNVLVFAGIFFGHEWGNRLLVTKSLLLFSAFCATASAIYVINDYWDRAEDRKHPKKRYRPIAGGYIDPRIAMLKAHMLLALGWVLAWYSGSGLAFSTVVIYTIMNILYSRWLKHIPIIDVALLSLSYLLRLIAGTEGIGIPISSWLFLCGLSAAMLMGFGKRLAEKHLIDTSLQRKSVQNYDETFLRMAITLSASIFLVFYGLYSLDTGSIALHGRKLVFTYPWILLGVFRYLQIVAQKNGLAEDPVTLMLRDRAIAGIVLSWLITFVFIVFW